MSGPTKVGFVGLSSKGWASFAIAPTLLKAPLSDKFSLTAVSTRSKESANESARKYSELAGHVVQAFHGDTSNIAGDPQIDLVAVAVKAPLHKAALLPVIEAGKDVFVEWPAGSSLKECEEFAAATRAKGVRSLVGLQGRHTLVVLKVKELISQGKIGKILSTSVIAMAPRELGYWGPSINESNAYTADVDGGATMSDIAIGHFLSIFIHVLGEFASVSATDFVHYPTAALNPSGKTIPVTGADHVAFTGLLKSGVFSSIVWRGGYPCTKGRKQLVWEIDGEEGSIRVESDEPSGAFIHIRDPKVYLNGELVDVQGDGVTGNIGRLWGEFAKGKEGEYATLDDAVVIHRVLNAMKVSAKEGRRVDL